MLSKIGFWVLMVLILVALNTATIVWLVYNFTPFKDYEISMWDANVLNGITIINGDKIQLKPDEYLNIAEKGAVYLFMVVGGISSAMFVKWLFLDTVKQVREKKKNKNLKKHLKDYEN